VNTFRENNVFLLTQSSGIKKGKMQKRKEHVGYNLASFGEPSGRKAERREQKKCQTGSGQIKGDAGRNVLISGPNETYEKTKEEGGDGKKGRRRGQVSGKAEEKKSTRRKKARALQANEAAKKGLSSQRGMRTYEGGAASDEQRTGTVGRATSFIAVPEKAATPNNR